MRVTEHQMTLLMREAIEAKLVGCPLEGSLGGAKDPDLVMIDQTSLVAGRLYIRMENGQHFRIDIATC